MKKSIKKVIAVALTGVLTASLLAGCSASSATDTEDTSTVAKTEYNIGICQLVPHDALDAATQGFKEKLTALGEENGITFTFDEQNAGGDSNTCATITNQFVSNGVDLIMANATASLQAAMQNTTEIPIVATSITDFATALDISEWSGTTGINVTGSSDLAPLEDQASMIPELFPDAKTVGILYCSAEANSKYQADVITTALEGMGITVNEYTIADTNQIADVTTKACGEVDVIYIPTDNTIASATAAVNEIAEPAGIPIVAGEEGICEGCGVATLSISYYSIGEKAAEMAYDILVNGKDPATMEIEYATDLTKEYVADRATALNVTIPDDYVAISTDDAE